MKNSLLKILGLMGIIYKYVVFISQIGSSNVKNPAIEMEFAQTSQDIDVLFLQNSAPNKAPIKATDIFNRIIHAKA